MAEELKQLNYSLQDADQSIIVQTMTVAESRRSRRLKTSPNVGGRPPRRLRSQATTSMIRCSSCTSLTILLTGATSSVNGSNQMPTSKISMIDRSIGFSLSSSSLLRSPPRPIPSPIRRSPAARSVESARIRCRFHAAAGGAPLPPICFGAFLLLRILPSPILWFLFFGLSFEIRSLAGSLAGAARRGGDPSPAVSIWVYLGGGEKSVVRCVWYELKRSSFFFFGFFPPDLRVFSSPGSIACCRFCVFVLAFKSGGKIPTL